MGMPSAIYNVDEHPLKHGINLFLYGPPGCGKTPTVAGPKTLILDLDAGAESAAGTGSKIWTIDTWADLDEAYEYLRHEPHPFDTVVMDSISIGQDKLLEDIMNDLIENRGKKHRKPYLIDQGEYGENMNRLKQWVTRMKALPTHFVVTGHPFPWENPETGDEQLWPWIQGRNMPQTICGHFNIIAYMTVNAEGDRMMRVKPNPNYYARDRFAALGAGLKNPTMATIIRRVEEKVRSTTPKKTTTQARKATPVKKAAPAQRAATRKVK